MHVLHQGRTYRVSAVKHDKKCLYIHTVLESLQIRDGVVEVLLNGRGLPLTH
ncbi:cell division protein FtsZ [Pseudescherichia sp.]|nr:cell division protein FtsZ [Pseudescherichia sp.]